jgi:MSHA pilin protein MshD
MSNRRLRRSYGLSIVEMVMFIVIVGVAAVGILRVINMTSSSSTDPVRRKQALLIAEAYMEEVQRAQFTVCDPADANAATATTVAGCAAVPENFGPEAGNTRPFDNINDYVPVGYVAGTPVRAFVGTGANSNVDVDVAGNRLGVDAVGGTLGNVVMSGITTTLTLNWVPNFGGIVSTASDIRTLQIIITVNYGPGQSIVLEGYRTRYQPSVL